MIEDGAEMQFFEVEDWYDCGRPETLLEANRVLLSRLETDGTADTNEAVLIPPVDIGSNVEIESSVVGPNVSIDDGARIRDSIVRDSIVGKAGTLRNVNISESIVGNDAAVESEANHLNVGDSSSIQL